MKHAKTTSKIFYKKWLLKLAVLLKLFSSKDVHVQSLSKRTFNWRFKKLSLDLNYAVFYGNCVGCYFWKHFLNFSIFSPLIVCNNRLPTFIYPWKYVSFHPPWDDLKRWWRGREMLLHLECLCSWSFNFAQYPSFSDGGASIKHVLEIALDGA